MFCPQARGDPSHRLPEPEVRETLLLRAPVPCFDEVSRDIHAQNVRAKLRCRQGRRAVAASEIEDLEPLLDPKRGNKRLTTLAHACGDAGEVALFPKCFVWIHGITASRASVEVKIGMPARSCSIGFAFQDRSNCAEAPPASRPATEGAVHLRRAQGTILVGHGAHLAIAEDVARANNHGTILLSGFTLD